jgi:hypothetical protein
MIIVNTPICRRAVRLFVLGFYQEQFSDQQGRTREQGPLKPDDASAPLADAR